MAWVWYATLDTPFRPADYDYKCGVSPTTPLRDMHVDVTNGPGIFRTRSKIAKFEALHCPPFDPHAVVDDVWQEIILRYVPVELVQFYPVRLIGKDGVSDKFSWVVPFSRVRCIDVQRSDVTSSIEKPDHTLIFGCNYYVHHDGCLKGLHLARDEQQLSHLVISDELRDALAATGEFSMFYSPENVPRLGKRNLH